jgi:hypothetical protein
LHLNPANKSLKEKRRTKPSANILSMKKFNSIPLSILDLALVLEGKTPAQSFKKALI